LTGGDTLAVIINRKFCKGCGICVAFCPKQVLELDELGKVVDKNAAACISCGQCELRCPDFAIQVVKKEKEAAK
jgi:2-oxoglutarate ferredoxin oxidoreductase subunit delta